jgi:hypothetical protein
MHTVLWWRGMLLKIGHAFSLIPFGQMEGNDYQEQGVYFHHNKKSRRPRKSQKEKCHAKAAV